MPAFVKTSSLLKNRVVFIKLCNDTMRILKKHLPDASNH